MFKPQLGSMDLFKMVRLGYVCNGYSLYYRYIFLSKIIFIKMG